MDSHLVDHITPSQLPFEIIYQERRHQQQEIRIKNKILFIYQNKLILQISINYIYTTLKTQISTKKSTLQTFNKTI